MLHVNLLCYVLFYLLTVLARFAASDQALNELLTMYNDIGCIEDNERISF